MAVPWECVGVEAIHSHGNINDSIEAVLQSTNKALFIFWHQSFPCKKWLNGANNRS